MLSKFILPIASRFFDFLEKIWNQHRTHVNVSRLLVYSFVLGLILSELAGRNLLPFEHHIHNHFFAVELASTLLLLTELLALIFVSIVQAIKSSSDTASITIGIYPCPVPHNSEH